ncbi:Uncharacterised protein [Burkholderia pseudomallei]|nr:Uncharacterised protein [Burkholderia pseudomallei]CAJ5122874.1 Uncharacterised protein [Burkholderia pseudomallei]
MPVPGPTITIGASPLAGGRKCADFCTNTGTGASAARSARNVDATPLRCRRPLP